MSDGNTGILITYNGVFPNYICSENFVYDSPELSSVDYECQIRMKNYSMNIPAESGHQQILFGLNGFQRDYLANCFEMNRGR